MWPQIHVRFSNTRSSRIVTNRKYHAYGEAGLYKVPYNLIFFPIFFKSLFSSTNLSLLSPFPHVIFFPTAMIFPSPLHNLIFFPNSLDKLGGGGLRSFIHPCCEEKFNTEQKLKCQKKKFEEKN